MLILDAGDYAHPNLKHEDEYNWFVLDGMGRMGYDAMTLGELELYRGTEYVERIVAESKVPITLANVTFATNGKRVADEYILIEREGIQLGIVGLLGQDFGEGIEKFEDLGFKVEDPFEAAARVIPEVQGQCDLVVVLAHMGSADTFQLPKQVAGIDLIVFGHYPGTVAATQVEGAVAVRSGQRGQYVGETRLVVSPQNEIASYTGKAVALTVDDICEDSALAADLTVIKDEADAKRKKAQLERELTQNENRLVLGQDHYLGDLKCARCHFDIYQNWKDTAHATAWESLVASHAETDTECIDCHVTGFRAPGGFRGVGADQDMRNVQCEACHGMGTVHNMLDISASVGEQACLRCHDAANSPAFDFETYWSQIAHGAR